MLLLYVLVLWPWGMWDLIPWPGWNPHPLHLSTGAPEKSLVILKAECPLGLWGHWGCTATFGGSNDSVVLCGRMVMRESVECGGHGMQCQVHMEGRLVTWARACCQQTACSTQLLRERPCLASCYSGVARFQWQIKAECKSRAILASSGPLWGAVCSGIPCRAGRGCETCIATWPLAVPYSASFLSFQRPGVQTTFPV